MSFDQPPDYTPRATLVFDGDCGFCRYWVARWRSRVSEREVEFGPYQEIAERFAEIPPENFKRAVHYIDAYGASFSGAEAVFRLMRHAPGMRWLLPAYQGVPGFKPVSEAVYRVIADHRNAAAKINKLLWGLAFTSPEHYIGRWLFLRNLGLIFFVAFFSLYAQLPGLMGSNGILPAAYNVQFLEETLGDDAHFRFPSVFWMDVSDEALMGGCLLGMGAAVLLTLGVAAPIMVFVAWGLYLSLLNVGSDFLAFQWDILLLETAFLAIFLAPFQGVPRFWQEPRSSPIVLLLLSWLLFRLMFFSGIVKLEDPTWMGLTALFYHYETQPLPTPAAWYVHQLPMEFHKASVAIMFFIELVVPFFLFFPRRVRHAAGLLIIFLQLCIAVTGNYTFFNWLTIALCLLLFDDGFYRALLPRALRDRILMPPLHQRMRPAHWAVGAALAVAIVPLSVVPAVFRIAPETNLPGPLVNAYEAVAGWQIVNTYGLFAHMTTTRPEIELQGSNDGVTWLTYEFKYKPGDPNVPPKWVAPHQPRLDWQMWFAALSSYETEPWVTSFAVRVLQGAPEVMALFEDVPFDRPPRFIRMLRYEYRFSDWETRRAAGAWWVREEKGEYLKPVSMNRGIF